MKISRESRSVEFTTNTGRACFRYAHTFNRFMSLSGATGYADRVVFADETSFSVRAVPCYDLGSQRTSYKIRRNGREMWRLYVCIH